MNLWRQADRSRAVGFDAVRVRSGDSSGVGFFDAVVDSLLQPQRACCCPAELGLGFEALLRHPKHLVGVRQPLARAAGTGERPVAGVQGGEQRLVAYVRASAEGVTAQELRAYLRERLPQYMTPAAYVLLRSRRRS